MIKTEVSLLFLILHYLSLRFSFDSGCPMNFVFIWSDTSLNQPEQLNYLAVQLVPIWNQAGKSYILPEIRQGRVVFYLSNVLICEWHYIWPSFNSNYWKSFKKLRYRQNCFLIKTILMIKKLKQNFNKFKQYTHFLRVNTKQEQTNFQSSHQTLLTLSGSYSQTMLNTSKILTFSESYWQTILHTFPDFISSSKNNDIFRESYWQTILHTFPEFISSNNDIFRVKSFFRVCITKYWLF